MFFHISFTQTFSGKKYGSCKILFLYVISFSTPNITAVTIRYLQDCQERSKYSVIMSALFVHD